MSHPQEWMQVRVLEFEHLTALERRLSDMLYRYQREYEERLNAWHETDRAKSGGFNWGEIEITDVIDDLRATLGMAEGTQSYASYTGKEPK